MKLKSTAVFIRSVICLTSLGVVGLVTPVQAQDKPNILIIWGDDIGGFNISVNNQGMMGYKTPNIDSIAKDGALCRKRRVLNMQVPGNFEPPLLWRASDNPKTRPSKPTISSPRSTAGSPRASTPTI